MAALLAGQAQAQSGRAEPARALQEFHTFFSVDDYPLEAQRRNAQGTVHFSLVIDKQGVPSRCIIDQSAGDPDLDRSTCEIMMRRARFSPARDVRGRPVEDRVSSQVRWVLPEDGPRGLPFAPLRFIISIRTESGVLRCRVTLEGQEIDSRQGEACANVVGPPIVDALPRVGADATVTTVLDLAPTDSPPRVDEADWGVLAAESAARFSLATDGRLLECRITRRQIYVRLPARSRMGDLCLHPMVSRQGFGPAPEGSAPRLGGIRMRIYYRAAAGP